MDKRENFGQLSAHLFEIGDIVEWSTWNSEESMWNYSYGVITKIFNEVRTSRMVTITKVMPLGGIKKEIELFALSLRLISRTKAPETKNEQS